MENEVGYVYTLTNPSFREDWVKIGKSSRPVDVRSKELDNTAVPLPFEIYATLKTTKYAKVERQIHKQIDRLTDLRIRQNREFFNIAPSVALDTMRDIADLLDDAELYVYVDGKPVVSKSKDEDKKMLILYQIKKYEELLNVKEESTSLPIELEFVKNFLKVDFEDDDDLIKNISIYCKLDFMKVSSYFGTTESSGTVNIKSDIQFDVKDQDVIIVDDIIDTGRTSSLIKNLFEQRGAKSVDLCCLLDKHEARLVDVDVKYVGGYIPNEFVVGYGLDYNELYRNLPYIGVLKEEIYR